MGKSDGKVIAVANQKGGVGKSTTAWALATGARYRGHTSLAVDMDSQGNLTYVMDGNALDVGLMDMLTGAVSTPPIQHTQEGDLIASSPALAQADILLAGSDRVYALRKQIDGLRKRFEYIVLDTPPVLGVLLLNALTAADQVIIPVQADVFSLQGLTMLIQYVNRAKDEYNQGLKGSKILFTRFNPRTVLARTASETIRAQAKTWHIPIMHTLVRESVAVREAEMMQVDLYHYALHNNATQDYLSVLDELNIMEVTEK